MRLLPFRLPFLDIRTRLLVISKEPQAASTTDQSLPPPTWLPMGSRQAICVPRHSSLALDLETAVSVSTRPNIAAWAMLRSEQRFKPRGTEWAVGPPFLTASRQEWLNTWQCDIQGQYELEAVLVACVSQVFRGTSTGEVECDLRVESSPGSTAISVGKAAWHE